MLFINYRAYTPTGVTVPTVVKHISFSDSFFILLTHESPILSGGSKKTSKLHMRKCYFCRKEYESEDIYCKDCRKKEIEGTLNKKGSSTFIIYHKV